MGERHEGMTIDRINNELGYSPENCRWATKSEQQNNRRDNHIVTLFGRSLNLTQWERELKVAKRSFHQFARKNKTTHAIAVETYARRKGFFPLSETETTQEKAA